MRPNQLFDRAGILRLEYWSKQILFISEPQHLNSDLVKHSLSGLGEDYLCLFPTSGTTRGYRRWVVNKQSHFLLQIAEALNSLNIPKGRRWGLLLPIYHVGGFAVYLRSVLNRGELLQGPSSWDPVATWQWLKQERIELISVVPTQLYDWIQAGLKAPSSLQIVFVGGAPLSESLWQQAMDLGWPLQRVYGMTETNAFFAYEAFGQKGYQPIPSYQLRMTESGELWIRSPYLALGYWSEQEGYTPLLKNVKGEWLGPDRVRPIKSGKTFEVVGRWQEDLFKRNGRSFSLSEVQKDLWRFAKPRLSTSALAEELSILVLCPCPRSQNELVFVYGGDESFRAAWMGLIKQWNEAHPWLPLAFCYLPFGQWPKTALGKVYVALLKEQVCALTKESLSSTVKQNES